MTHALPRPGEALSADLDRTRRTREMVERLIAEPALLGPDFAPIRRLDAAPGDAAGLLGWKATGRGAPGTVIADTLSLLAQAAELGLVERLDWAFRAHTFDVALDSGLTGELHLTPEPDTFGSPCPPRLAVPVLRGRRALTVCAELHADSFDDEARMLAAVDEMHGWGWHMVYADLLGTTALAAAQRLAARIRPAYVQVDLSMPGRAQDPALPGWLELAAGVGASVLALGVDSDRAREAARSLGAVYGRGALLGAPVPRPR
ncbi:MAG: EAL domain-containing protein [Frankiales bacterium]|nr:EAL domain-containing protein [Frankiales bacterium]